jgi:hypothetical protein
MINRDEITAYLDRTASLGGDRQLEELETHGYRVVPAGLVPQFEDLDTVTRLLKVLGDVGGRIHNPVKCREAANQLEWLRDLAMLVLRIDPDAMEDASNG